MKKIRMKKADWKEWDAALRSGKYEQARDVLHDGGNGYCCLGVLQTCLDGEVKTDRGDELPALEWLAEHGIEFRDRGSELSRAPFLPALDQRADSANDKGIPFVAIADAIAEAVEFTD